MLYRVWNNKWLLALIFGFNHNNNASIPAQLGYLDAFKVYSTLEYDPYGHTMDYAAENGHLDVIKWLHTNRTEGCTSLAMGWAAQNGHLEVVKWLHTNRPYSNTVWSTNWAMNLAADNCHIHVVKYLEAFK